MTKKSSKKAGLSFRVKLSRLFLLLPINILLLLGSHLPVESFQSTDWENITSRSLSAEGKSALAIDRGTWQHSETENFVYHFRNEKEAETFLVHAELYYQWIQEILGVQNKKWTEKSHLFIFEDKQIWKKLNMESPERIPGAEGFTNGQDMFVYRDPFWLTPQLVLAHELTHLVLYRIFKGWVPLFLNEGFAEFMAIKAAAMKADGNEFNIRSVQMISEDQFIPVKKLIAMRQYPSSEEEVKVFYRQSELLVRYLLLNHDKSKFYELLKETVTGTTFEKSLKNNYDLNVDDLEDKFKAYAQVTAHK